MPGVLSDREQAILNLMAQGMTNREIAAHLNLAFETIRWYAKQIYSKLEVRNRTEAVSVAQSWGLLDHTKSDATPNNLPVPLTSFVGRSSEMAMIRRLIARTRLLTLTGAGGSGKTRLCLNIAYTLMNEFSDGVFFVDLASLHRSQLVPTVIAQTLHIGEVVGEEQINTLIRVLKNREILLVLDNFEHLMAAAGVVSDLLKGTSALKIMVTSRENLHLTGEQEYRVPPLSLPDQDADLTHAAQSEAVALFVQRAQMVDPAFSVTVDNVREIITICQQLDGLPLAIELAAAHCKVLTPNDILVRLLHRMDLLASGHKDAPDRHQSIRKTIQWSFELLDEEYKSLFCRLGVFAGGFSLDAVTALSGGTGTDQVLMALIALVNKSLIYPIPGAVFETRFIMLETIREFAYDRLTLGGKVNEVYQHMADYYVTMAEKAENKLRMSEQKIWYRRLDLEHENIRAVLEWCIAERLIEQALRLITGLRDFWFYQGFHTEGLYWLQRLSRFMNSVEPVLRGRALVLRGLLLYAQQKKAESFLQEALAIFRELEDKQHIAWALTFQAFSLESRPESYTHGVACGSEGLELFQQLHHAPGIAWALNVLGNLERINGNNAKAEKLYQDCLEICRQTGEQRRVTMILGNLGIIAEQMLQYDRAYALIRESILLANEIDFKYTIPAKLSLMAGVLAGQGHTQQATRILSASLAINESMGIVAQANTHIEIVRYLSDLKEQLEQEAFAAFWQEGQTMSLDHAIELALSEVS